VTFELKVTWVFDRDSARNPFIAIAVETLRAAGAHVFIIDGADEPTAAPHTVHPFGRGRRFHRYEQAKAFINQSPLIRVFDRRAYMRDRGDELRRLKSAGRGRGAAATALRLKIYAAAAISGIHYLLWRGIRRLALIPRDTIDLWIPYTRGFFSLLRRRSDVIVASRPTALLGAWVAAKLRGVRLVYYPFELYGEQAAEFSKLVLAWERWILRRGVDALITQNSDRARVYAERGFRGRAAIVHNYKPLAKPSGRGGLRATLGMPATTKIALYEGMLIPGRWLDRLAAASLLLPDDMVMVFLGPTKSWWDAHHASFTAEPVAKRKLIIAPPVPHDQLLDYISDADAGVVIYDDSLLNNYYCEPGKLSDYAFAEIPVVAPDFPTVGPVIAGLGIGAVFRECTPEGMAAAIVEVLSRPRDAWRPALQHASKALAWETQAPALIDAVLGEDETQRRRRSRTEKRAFPSPFGRGDRGEGSAAATSAGPSPAERRDGPNQPQSSAPSPPTPLPKGEGGRALRARRRRASSPRDARESVDILILVEHADRELDVACLIAARIARAAPRLAVKIANFYTEAQRLIATTAPRVVVTPFFYAVEDAVMRDYVAAWSRSIFVNLAWEQILYGSQQTLKRPRDAFTRDKVRHVAWSEWFRDYLIGHGVAPAHVDWLGHPLYDLYDPVRRDGFADRRELARNYNLDPEKKWIFFPENFRWAFFGDEKLAALEAQGVPPADLEAQRVYCHDALAASARWLAAAAKVGDCEAILRPRPAVSNEKMRDFVAREIGAAPRGFHILKQRSARDWIFASDVTVSSISTTLIEAAVAGKPIMRLAPVETPPSMWYDWCAAVPGCRTQDEFLAAIAAPPDLSGTNAVRAWAEKAFKVGESPTDAIAQLLIRLVNRAPRAMRLAPPIPETPPWLRGAEAIAPLKLRHRLRARYQPGYFFNLETHEKDLFGESEIRRRTARWRRSLKRAGNA